MLQSPQVLAKLPKSLEGDKSRIYAADVHTVARGKKRKRSELVVAVDNESINLYNLRTSSLTTTYSVSSSVSFTCPPCSIRQRDSGITPTQRSTYCSIGGAKPRIQCFVENAGKVFRSDGHISTTSYSIVDSTSPVVFLGTIDSSGDDGIVASMAVIVVHRDGALRCLSKDLSKEYWRRDSNSMVKGTRKLVGSVECAAIIDIDQARRGFLQRRQDLLAMLQNRTESAVANFSDPSLLVLVVRYDTAESSKTSQRVELRLSKISAGRLAAVAGTTLTRSSSVDELVSFTVPQPTELVGRKSIFQFSHSNGTLYHYIGKHLAVYDFTSPTPRLDQHIKLKSKILSCLRLSSAAVVLNTASTISLLDTHYKSIQGARDIEQEIEDIRNKVESGSRSDKPANLKLLTYSSRLKLLVGVVGRSLISCQLEDTRSNVNGSRKRIKSGLLIDAIGKGLRNSTSTTTSDNVGKSSVQAFGDYVQPASSEAAWEAKKVELDVLASKADTDNFDYVMFAELDTLPALDSDNSGNGAIEEPRNNGSNSSSIRPKLTYLFSKMFDLYIENSSRGTPSKLRVKLLPRKTFEWLLKNRHFSRQHVESALKHTGLVQASTSFPASAVVTALASFDESLSTLEDLFTSPTNLITREVVCGIRIAIDALQKFEGSEETKLLTNGEIASNSDERSGTQIVPAESDRTGFPGKLKQNEHQTHTAQAIMETCVSRLYHYHEVDIRKALKQELLPPDLLFLIDYLRMSLARGGWLSRYVDDAYFPVEGEAEPVDEMGLASKLMNCAIDSLGSGGWISGSSSSVDMAESGDTIAYMKAEISAALEGIEEAAYLNGMLNEVLLYSKTAKHLDGLHMGTSNPNEVKPIPVTFEDEILRVLPIGLNADQGVGLTRVGAGGELQARSARDIGRLKSRKIGHYTFERIMV